MEVNNNWTLIGRLANDIKLYNAQKNNNIKYGYIKLAVESPQKVTYFIDIALFGKIAEIAEQYIKKGDLACLGGVINTIQKKDQQYSSISLIAKKIKLINPKHHNNKQKITDSSIDESIIWND